MAMSFPVANSTQSFWRTQPHDLDTHRSTPELPSEVDIVIIGAGYAGASIAHHLLEKTKNSRTPPSIAILEAREACSGATGRNGGHLKPDPYYRAAAALRKHGRAAAEEVASFEARHVREMKAFIEQENIDCDFVLTRATDVCLYEDAHRDLKGGLDELTRVGVSTAADVHYSGPGEAEGVSGVKGAKACFTYTAGHMWPYKFVLHLLASAIAKGVNLQTNTPVHSLSQSPDKSWNVTTPRGSINAKKIILATNAYTSSLLPEFKEKIIPVRGICSRITVPEGTHAPLLSNSYILRIAPGEYDYLIPKTDGSIIVGGARRDYHHNLSHWYNNADDSSLIPSASSYFDGYMRRHFRGWENSGAKTEKVWTGIMGYSSDGFPWVGEVQGREGVWVCAGFSGHGMPQVFLAGKAVAGMVCGEREGEELPRLYRITEERMGSRENVILEGWNAIYGKEERARL